MLKYIDVFVVKFLFFLYIFLNKKQYFMNIVCVFFVSVKLQIVIVQDMIL